MPSVVWSPADDSYRVHSWALRMGNRGFAAVFGNGWLGVLVHVRAALRVTF